MKRLLLAALTGALLAPAALAGDNDADTRQLLSALADEAMLPRLERLASSSAKLEASLERHCQTPLLSSLRAARHLWLQTYTDWMEVAPVNWGPTALRRTQRQIAFKPVRPELVEAAVSSDAGRNDAEAERVGVPAKGFAAVEYLLYRQPAKLTEPARCAYLMRQGRNIAAEAKALRADWQDFASELKQAGQPQAKLYPKSELALEELTNLLIAGVNELREKELGKLPSLKREAVLASYSGQGRQLAEAQWRGLQALLTGLPTSGYGLDDYLDRAKEKPVLARQLRNAGTEVADALHALPANLADAASGDREKPATAALAQLQRLLEEQVVQVLDVTVSFNESDGD